MRAESGFGGREPDEPPADIPGRGEFGEKDSGAQHQRHRREDDRHGALALSVAALLVVTAEHGDKGDGGSSADEEIGDHVGKLEGGVEGVGVGVASEKVGDVLYANEADD